MKYGMLARLVERAKRGEEDAFEQIYNEFSKSVYYLGLRITKNEQDAHDVVQETMLDLHKNLHSIKNTQALTSYVNRIALHRCIRILQKKNLLQMNDDTERALQNEPEDNEEFIPEEFAKKKEQREYIISLIKELNETQRSVVLLFYYKQMPVKQIAEIIGIDESAVKKRLSRARAVLKQKLETGMKDMVMSIMSTPVLTRILQADADAAFTSEISTQIWQEIASKLGYSVATIAATTEAATTAATTFTGTAAASTASGVTTTILPAFLATAAAVGMVGGGILLYKNITGPPVPLQTTIAETNPPTSSFQYDNSDITSGGHAGVDIYSASSTQDQQESQTAVHDAGPDGGAPESDTSDAPTESAPFDEAGATTPAEASGILGEPKITVKNWELSYPVGASVTPERLLSDAGVVALDANGRALDIHMEYFDLIDWGRQGEYAVYVKAIDKNGLEFARIAIIISIISQEKLEVE